MYVLINQKVDFVEDKMYLKHKILAGITFVSGFFFVLMYRYKRGCNCGYCSYSGTVVWRCGFLGSVCLHSSYFIFWHLAYGGKWAGKCIIYVWLFLILESYVTLPKRLMRSAVLDFASVVVIVSYRYQH